MVTGIDARAPTKGGPSVQALCASTNSFFTSYYTTWRTRESERSGVDYTCPPKQLLVEALLNYLWVNRRLPTTLIVYRSGVSESQEESMLRSEVQELCDGGLQRAFREAVDAEAAGTAGDVDLDSWSRNFTMAYVLVRRNTRARFCTEEKNNVPGGTVIERQVVASRTPEFFMVSQSVRPAVTARPTLYSLLYNDLQLSLQELKDLTFMLCGLHATFAGRIAIPAPLNYAVKTLSILCKMNEVPPRPEGSFQDLRDKLCFV
eukprot:TRINITY_DN80556_c0_g1_i1.p1 TRINITY_DN80556_c0_g1~~TRINITY_DN80556_c0_g1_i1.p1  ORF type:complete len:261 (-),score=40.24 TRINITY_DN80556_c0_g1_i1:61-843(-)